MRGCEEETDRGFVTAESAMVLPVLVLFTTALVWGLMVVAAQIRCVDAARTGARAAARQDPPDAVTAVTREAAPRGAKITVGREGGRVRVVVEAKPPALRGLPFELREEAVALAEESGPGTEAGTAEGAVAETPPGVAAGMTEGAEAGTTEGAMTGTTEGTVVGSARGTAEAPLDTAGGKAETSSETVGETAGETVVEP